MHEVAETVWAHPTISEAIKEAAEDSLSMALTPATAQSTFRRRRRCLSKGVEVGYESR